MIATRVSARVQEFCESGRFFLLLLLLSVVCYFIYMLPAKSAARGS